MRIIGIDPGLNKCGWGVIEYDSGRLKHVANGVITPNSKHILSKRLLCLDEELTEILKVWNPEQAAIEETFVNKSPSSSLKLGHARGVAMVSMARYDLDVHEYGANLVKKSVVGAGHAEKVQVMMMIRTLLPGVELAGEDSADALAVAICHANHHSTLSKIHSSI